MTRGLRPESFSARNSPWLTKCLNLRATSEGLKQYYSLNQPITDNYITSTLGETKAWPFPQLFHGKSVTLLCFNDAVYTVDEDTYLCTLVDTKSIIDGTSAAITSGKDWHFVDLYGSWMLFNGSCVVFKTGWSSTVYVQSSVTINTGVAHKEARVLLGGFDPTNFYARADWQTFWTNLAGDMPAPMDNMTQTAPGKNWIWWSSFMAPDLLWLFFKDALNYQSYDASPDTGITSDRPFAFDLFERNEAGMRPMPWRKKVLGMLPLGDGVCVYGVNGIRYLNPYSLQGVHTYGVQNFIGLPDALGVYEGTYTRTPFAGGIDRQIFVEPSGELWQLTPDLHAERLGYKEHLSTLDINKTIITHDSLYNEFYIADGTKCYHLSKTGLTQCPTMPTKIYPLKSGNIGTIKFSTGSSAAQVETQKMVTPSGELETLTRVRVVGLNSASNGWTLTINYRTKPTEDFYATGTLTLDAVGEWIGALPVLEYQIQLNATTASGVTCEDVEVEFDTECYGGSTLKLNASAPSAATE